MSEEFLLKIAERIPPDRKRFLNGLSLDEVLYAYEKVCKIAEYVHELENLGLIGKASAATATATASSGMIRRSSYHRYLARDGSNRSIQTCKVEHVEVGWTGLTQFLIAQMVKSEGFSEIIEFGLARLVDFLKKKSAGFPTSRSTRQEDLSGEENGENTT